jgi:hypothetical protein
MNTRFIWVIAAGLLFSSCSNSSDKSSGPSVADQADSLRKLVLHIHDEGMAGSNKIDNVIPELQKMADSLGKLPQKAGDAAAELKEKCIEALTRLQKANDDMYLWMEKMYIGDDADAPDVKLKKLLDEEIKAVKVKESIANSLRKADSLIKAIR